MVGAGGVSSAGSTRCSPATYAKTSQGAAGSAWLPGDFALLFTAPSPVGLNTVSSLDGPKARYAEYSVHCKALVAEQLAHGHLSHCSVTKHPVEANSAQLHMPIL